MASDHASRTRLDALTAPDPPGPSVPSPAPEGAAPSAEQPDPDFWGVEPRRVRRTRRAEPETSRPGGSEWLARLVDRARDRRLDVGVGVVAVVIVALVAGVVWYRIGVAGGDAPPVRAAARTAGVAHTGPTDPAATRTSVPAGATAGPAPTTSASAGRGTTSVVVHVAGAVAKPGVLVMPAGARVIDAVEGAGGATPDADLDRINLAAKLVDGQRILVVKVGQAVVADPGDAGAPVGATDPAAVIDLNAATSAQLETLPGIGPTLAGAIIEERDRRGGFRSVNELREVRGIGDARFAQLRDRVTV